MPTVLLEPATYADAAYVARRMRPGDANEILPLLWGGAEDLALSASAAHYARTAFYDGKPVAVVGGTQTHPACWQVFMFATNDWPRVALSALAWPRVKGARQVPTVRSAAVMLIMTGRIAGWR